MDVQVSEQRLAYHSLIDDQRYISFLLDFQPFFFHKYRELEYKDI